MYKLKKFKVTLMVPHDSEIEATDLQDAHNQVTKMVNAMDDDARQASKVHSIEEVVEQKSIDFGPSPAE